jgi:predicted TIM-barrel fold metal-dependent hydrolase
MTFGKEHGAVSVLIRHLGHDRALGDENLIPIYEKALDLDLAITVHTGSEWHPQGILSRSPTAYLHHVILTVPGALWSALKADLPQRYPKLRIGFLEAGAMWLPHVLQEKFRQDEKFLGEEEGATFQERRNQWRQTAIDALQEYELYVAVHMDDDLPYLLTYGTENRLVHGTDFGHLDAGSDPNGPNMIATRADIDRNVAHKIVDENARRLYGIDPSFTPAPPAVSDKPVLRGMVEAH